MFAWIDTMERAGEDIIAAAHAMRVQLRAMRERMSEEIRRRNDEAREGSK